MPNIAPIEEHVAAVAAVYDEHEERRARYAGRVLLPSERRDLALAGLAEVLRDTGGTVTDLENAMAVCEVMLGFRTPVGQAIASTIRTMNETAEEA